MGIIRRLTLDVTFKLGRNPVNKHHIQPEYGNEEADGGGSAEPVSPDPFLKRERGQGNIFFQCSADHKQGWQPYPVDPYTCYMCDHRYSSRRNNNSRIESVDGNPRSHVLLTEIM